MTMTRFRDELPDAKVPWDHCVECGDPIYHKPLVLEVPRCRPCQTSYRRP